MSAEKDLQASYQSEARAQRFYKNQMLNHLNERMLTFIPQQEMLFISTADAAGHCDASIRVGPKGFIHILDPKTIAYPEYRGNGVYASLGNIVENGHIGLLMIDFYDSTIGLHINGRAEIVNQMPHVHDPLAERWVQISIDEAYIQCSKHIPRLLPAGKHIVWNTDDEKLKGGDFFDVQKSHS
jgi:predicted pyridoxine 5'-phosphate oxidase superfamily flavin-nucleotide-binding protein